MRLSGHFQACLFFLRKGFERTKKVSSKNHYIKQKQANKKQQRQQFLTRTKVIYTQNLFVKKKISRLEIGLITSYTLLMCVQAASNLCYFSPCAGSFLCSKETFVNSRKLLAMVFASENLQVFVMLVVVVVVVLPHWRFSFLHCFSSSSLILLRVIARFLHPFYTFSSAHRRVIRNTFT